MPVSVLVPRWLAPRLRAAFQAAGIAFEIREAYVQVWHDPESDEATDFEDRFTFPGVADEHTRGVEREHAAAFVQRIVDSVPETQPDVCREASR